LGVLAAALCAPRAARAAQIVTRTAPLPMAPVAAPAVLPQTGLLGGQSLIGSLPGVSVTPSLPRLEEMSPADMRGLLSDFRSAGKEAAPLEGSAADSKPQRSERTPLQLAKTQDGVYLFLDESKKTAGGDYRFYVGLPGQMRQARIIRMMSVRYTDGVADIVETEAGTFRKETRASGKRAVWSRDGKEEALTVLNSKDESLLSQLGVYAEPAGAKESALYPEMVKFLVQNGIAEASIVTDAADLLKPGAEEALLGKGFVREAGGQDGARIYTLGEATLYMSGQRAIFEKDGRVRLVTFAHNEVNHANFMAIITLGPDGSVLGKAVQRLP
jgi:hypothetical protein